MDLIDLCSLLLKDSEGVYVYEPTTVETTQGKETGGPSKGVHISLESLVSSLTGVIFVLVTLVVPPYGDRFDQARPRLTHFSFS